MGHENGGWMNADQSSAMKEQAEALLARLDKAALVLALRQAVEVMEAATRWYPGEMAEDTRGDIRADLLAALAACRAALGEGKG